MEFGIYSTYDTKSNFIICGNKPTRCFPLEGMGRTSYSATPRMRTETCSATRIETRISKVARM